MSIQVSLVGLGIILAAQFTVYLGLKIWAQFSDNNNRKNEFETKLAMAEAQSKSTVVKGFDDLIKTLDFSISFYCINESLYIDKKRLEEDELNSLVTEYTATISANVISNLSDEFKRQLYTYVTEDWLMYYIRKTSFIKFTARMEGYRK